MVVLTGMTVFDGLLPPLIIIDGTEVRMETINAFVSCFFYLGSVMGSSITSQKIPLFSKEIMSRVRVECVRFQVSLCVCRCRTSSFTGGERH